jgi:hypothetical protein
MTTTLASSERALLRDREAARDAVGIEPDAEPFEDRLGTRSHHSAVDPPSGAQRLAADEDVLDHGQIREQGRLLVNHRDAGVPSVRRAAEGDLDAVHEQPSAVGSVHPGEDLHERRLARPILSDERVRLTGIEVDRDVLERLDRPERLRRVLEREDGLRPGQAHRRRGGPVGAVRLRCHG